MLGESPKKELHGQQINIMIPDMYMATHHINWLFEAQNTDNVSPKFLLADLPVLRILELGICTKYFDLCSEVSFQSLESLKIDNIHCKK